MTVTHPQSLPVSCWSTTSLNKLGADRSTLWSPSGSLTTACTPSKRYYDHSLSVVVFVVGSFRPGMGTSGFTDSIISTSFIDTILT